MNTAESVILNMKAKKTKNFIRPYFDVELRGLGSVDVKFEDWLANQLIRAAREDDTQSVWDPGQLGRHVWGHAANMTGMEVRDSKVGLSKSPWCKIIQFKGEDFGYG